MKCRIKHEDRRKTVVFLATGALCIAVAASVLAAPISHLWSAGFGNTGDDDANAVAVDQAGNVVVVGNFCGTVNFGGDNLTSAGGTDIFIAKYDVYGVHQWSKCFGGTVNDQAYGVAIDGARNVYVTGYFQGTASLGGSNLTSAGGLDIFLAMYYSNGMHAWSKRFGNADDQAGLDLAWDGVGVVMTGYFYGTMNFGGPTLTSAGSADIFLAQFDKYGVSGFSKRFGGAGGDWGRSVAINAGAGHLYMTGYFQNSANFGGVDLVSAGGDDVVLAKYDLAGVHEWSQRFGGTGDDDSYSVAVDDAASVLIAGSFQGTANFGGRDLVCTDTADGFVASYSSQHGGHWWSRRVGGSGWDHLRAVAVDMWGDVWVTGWFEGTGDFGGGNLVSAGSRDVVIARYNINSAHEWSQRFGGVGDDRGYAVALVQGNDLAAAGSFQASVDFGDGSLTSAGGRDIWIVKFGENPDKPAITSISDIGNDQGRRVKIRFNRSSLDDASSLTPVLRYIAFRRDSPAPPAVGRRGPAGLSARALLDLGWTEVGSVHAFTKDSYGIDVATLGDSNIAHGPYYSVFFIRAATATPTTFYDSLPDSGYSIDNLSPGVPGSLDYDAGMLTWKKSSAEDFDHFTVYGANERCFCSATLIDECVVPSMDVSLSPYEYYFVTAIDASGNEGTPAVVNALTGIGGTPTRYVLSVSAYPNPFNPETTIRYTVPSKGHVEVSVYDARGAHVATLVNEEKIAGAYTQVWNGRDDTGRAVSSGVYFARVTRAQAVRSYKMVLLK